MVEWILYWFVHLSYMLRKILIYPRVSVSILKDSDFFR